MFDLYFIIQISLLLLTCFVCYYAGKEKGVDDIITLLIEFKMIDSNKLQRLAKILSDK